MPRLCLPVVLVLLSAWMPATAAELDTLLDRLRREPPISEPFQDVRYRRALTRPLVSRGELAWNGGFDFQRTVAAPYRETARLSERTLVMQRERGPERVIPLARAPELDVLFAGLAALFAGDGAAIERLFQTDLQAGESWQLRLIPREQRLRERVPLLELRGQGEQVRCLIVHQPGAEVLSVLGPAPPLVPEADLASTVARLCPTS